MYTKVMPDQFKIKDGAIIHTPTGAEFTPVTGTRDSILIWTGDIGSILQTGESYGYADVFAVMKTIWQQGFQAAQKYVVKDANGQSLAYVYGRERRADANTAHVLTMDEARRIGQHR